MEYPIDRNYYTDRKPELLQKYETEARIWNPFVFGWYGEIQGYRIIQAARQEFENLIPQILYIGGDENRRTQTLVQSVHFLAFYLAMKKIGKTAEETGKLLFKALVEQVKNTPQNTLPAGWQDKEKYFQIRKEGAASSQQKRYPGDYVFRFVSGEGRKYDYGYDYTECAAVKFFHQQGADEFMPFCCYLDYPICAATGLGFSRTKTLRQGDEKCNHRFTPGKETKLKWPPPFLKKSKREKQESK
jgi:hypothetical protein